MASMDSSLKGSYGAPYWEMVVVGTDGIARAHVDATEGVIWHKADRGSPRVFYRNQNDTIAAAVANLVQAIQNGSEPTYRFSTAAKFSTSAWPGLNHLKQNRPWPCRSVFEWSL